MICEICGKNEATIHIQELINSKKKALHICNACAESKGMAKEMLNGLDLAQLMYNISADVNNSVLFKDLQAKVVSPPPMKCPNCGWDIVRFTNIGRLGCAECFKTFRTILDQAIRNMHKGSLHVGKKPGDLANASPETMGGKEKPANIQDKMACVMELQKRLEEYIMREEYEKAADARDKIAVLKGGLTEYKTPRVKEGKNDKH
jgi:protein arginine kinase activator